MEFSDSELKFSDSELDLANIETNGRPQPQTVQYPTKFIESMEESEAKNYKSKPELRNSNVNADYAIHQRKYSNQLLTARSLFTINHG